MSAESTSSSRPRGGGQGGPMTGGGGGGGPMTVTPQQVTDPTILDSVAGFINDVVPSSYAAPCDTDDKIQWAHFEQLDCEESTFAPSCDSSDTSAPTPLVLILGYSTGIQVWAIPANGEAVEILSWRHSSFRLLKVIPTPFKTGLAENVDLFATARPLIALCDSTTNFCTLTFRSLKSGFTDPVKQIQFKTTVLNVLANRRSVIASFQEKIAVFDAFTLENRLSVTTCYLSPGLQPNPITLGARWLAYAEKKQIGANRSGGGNEGEGVQSYTATVLHAAKSLGRGLRELTESVAGSLTGNPNFKPGTSPNSPQAGGATDVLQKGIVTVLDIENKNISTRDNVIPQDAVIAHFVAHTEAIVCMSFDPSGMLLLTADKRGHDFHVFRIQSHPAGPALAAVHHLYTLHRGDTTAKVQDMCFSPDSRWVTVSTLRGTTHVFPITPYGGNINVRTHATTHVVNKMSRYQRSAGLTSEGRSSSPVSVMETSANSLLSYRNPRLPPYPQATVINPLAQIRQPVYVQNTGNATQRPHTGRQRAMSSSEENISLKVVARFALPRAWVDPTKPPREPTHKQPVKPVESLFIMSCYGNLVQYDLDPLPTSSVPKERVCNDTAIDLKVVPKAQWDLHRRPNALDVPLPMKDENLNLIAQSVPLYKKSKPDHNDDHWLSQVEIVTHQGPHRRLWMGPQFTFKTYTFSNGSVMETHPVDVGRSKPVNMPVSKANAILIESGSANSCEQLFLDTYHRASNDGGSAGELQLREDLADAMLESPGIRETGGHCVIVSVKQPPVAKVVNPLGTVVTVQSDDEAEVEVVEDAVIHENCDEALFRPVVAPKAVFYAETKPKTCPPENILTKSLEANTEVAVRILNKSGKIQLQESNKDNKALSSTTTTTTSSTTKHINAKSKSRESSPRPKHAQKSKENINSAVDSNKSITKSSKSELNSLKARPRKTETKPNNDAFSDPWAPSDPQSPLPPLSSKAEDFDILSLSTTDFAKFEPPEGVPKADKFEDAEDCIEKVPAPIVPPPVSITKNNETELTCSSEEEKLVTRKTRKPKTKLGVKIPSNKEATKNETAPITPPKKSWNIVAASMPSVNTYPVFDLPDFECSDFTFKLSDKDINRGGGEIIEDFNLVKIDKSSDDEKPGSSPAETTESSSDDSSKVPIANIMDMDEELIPSQNMQSSSKASKRRSKKKRK